MTHGYISKILRVDLASGKISQEILPDEFYRQYFGGEGFVGYFLLKELKPDIDPLGPENKLIFASGPLTGVPAGGCGRHSVGGKSPLTGGFGEADAGGFWGAELKFSGFDAIIIEGKSERPVYLFVHDGQAELRDASHLWGLKTRECQGAIRSELGDTQVKVAQIGPAGENLVRFACIVNDLDAFAGRTGLGAVMGSKKLKAIACRGRNRLSLAKPDIVATIARWIRDNSKEANRSMHDHGTASVVSGINRKGGLPTFNFQWGSFDGADKIKGETMTNTILTRRRGCYACPVQCKREVKIDIPFIVDPVYGGPEYETIAAIGSNCGIDDLKVIAKGNEIAAAYGLDTISCGGAIAFAMECFDRGLLTSKDTDGLDLRFGNGAAMLQMMERIALRKGIGAVLAEGVARAAKSIGRGADEFALHVKGQEFPMHEPRWKQGLGVGYAVSPTGADHCHNMHDAAYTRSGPWLDMFKPFGVAEPLSVDDLSAEKVRLLIAVTHWQHFMNCAVCCYFVLILGMVGFNRISQLVNAATGWDTDEFELLKVGERAVNLARAFNVRAGFLPADDTMPKRFFTPQQQGPLQGIAPNPDNFQKAVETYYKIMNWPQGRPSAEKLTELGISWVDTLVNR